MSSFPFECFLFSRKHLKNETEKKPRFTIPYYCFASTTSSLPRTTVIYLSRYLRAVRLPSQNSAKAKKLGGRSTARKSPIGEGQ